MAKMGKFSVKGLKEFQNKLNKIRQGNVEEFINSCAKELVARLLAVVIARTPVGEYPSGSGKRGGTLRRGWTAKTHEEAVNNTRNSKNAREYANSLTINHVGNTLIVEVINPVEYASYVEYGHRTTNHRGWVEGRFMLTISEQEIQEISPAILERKVKQFLGKSMR